MSAAEIIEHIKALPARERREVENFVRTSNGDAESGNEGIRYASADRVREISSVVFSENETLFRKLAE